MLFNVSPDNGEYEVIIINDGSDEAETMLQLDIFRKKKYTVIDQANLGLAAARNTGIAAARGAYILFLDADNCIEPDFLQQAVKVLEAEPDVAVVYSDALYFGHKEGRWVVGEFNLQRLMIANYIDACAMVRKSVFNELGGYDTAMKTIKSGWEDWDMWLRIAFSGKQFRYLPLIGFRYRVAPESMIAGINKSYEIRNRLTTYLHQKYPNQLGHQHINELVIKRFKPHPFKFIIKLGMMAWFNKHYQKLVGKNKVIDSI